MHPRSGTRLWIPALTVLLLAGMALADATTGQVDKLFAEWDTTVTPGAALAVVRDGTIIYERGYGMASLEDGLVMTPQKVFDIGSTSKQFTAACMAMLIREGKVGLSDDIRKHLPEMPDYGKVITVDHLLHHTSGLRDYNALLELSGFRADADCPTVEEAYEVICRQKRLNYLPGAEYSYTNTGFFLLSRIVEKVSGKSLNAFAQERIFKPLGMTHTLFQDDHNQIIRNRARGYERAGDGYRINMSNWDETGDGNVYTTVEDLALWDQAFITNALGKDLMDMLHTRGVLNDGKKIEYAFGLMIGDAQGPARRRARRGVGRLPGRLRQVPGREAHGHLPGQPGRHEPVGPVQEGRRHLPRRQDQGGPEGREGQGRGRRGPEGRARSPRRELPGRQVRAVVPGDVRGKASCASGSAPRPSP